MKACGNTPVRLTSQTGITYLANADTSPCYDSRLGSRVSPCPIPSTLLHTPVSKHNPSHQTKTNGSIPNASAGPPPSKSQSLNPPHPVSPTTQSPSSAPSPPSPSPTQKSCPALYPFSGRTTGSTTTTLRNLRSSWG